jgi:two-component system sensor histidine kinase CpxA
MALLKTLRLGISLKLFIAFWLVIISSVSISYFITLQFKQTPTQGVADAKQLLLLSQYAESLPKHRRTNLKDIRNTFIRKNNLHLIIKSLSTNKVHLARKRAWHRVHNYLKNNALPNPVTIDFSYTKITGSQEVILNGDKYQLFIASPIDRQQLTTIIDRLPVPLRAIIMLIISFLLCWLLAKAFSKPLIAIQKASDALGKGDLTARLNGLDKRSDEFGSVARSFNNMADQLEHNISAHQRLLGDVSHELRSPLTRLQLAIGLAEKNSGNEAEQQKHLRRCENEVDRLDDMIGDVLTLSRLEHTTNTLHTESVDLTRLVKHIIEDCQYIANDKNITITECKREKCMLSGDRKLLSSAISNVLNNAVNYSPNDADIQVNLLVEHNQIKLTITDQGTGVPEAALSELFTPFFRVADSRERSSGGTGLGLAIAQQAIAQHQGRIYAKNLSPHGLAVSIILPTDLLNNTNRTN